MKHLLVTLCVCLVVSCGGGSPTPSTIDNTATSSESSQSNTPGGQDDFGTHEGDASGGGVNGSKLSPTSTEAVLKLIVQTDEQKPVPGIVVKATTTNGHPFYTPETDALGYTEVMAPIGQEYTLTYLSLFQDEVSKMATIPNEPNITMKLKLTYIPLKPKPIQPPDEGKLIESKEYNEPTLILNGVEFDTGKATLHPVSFPHLEKVVEFLTYKPNAMIELSGHTDNVGKPKKNKKLSENRAMAVREYLVSKGIEGDRIIAVGYGQERPIANNDTEAGRQLNRRTEAKEIGK